MFELLNEKNWYLRAWYGGTLYDPSELNQPVPQPVEEICLHHQIKLSRDLVVDIYVAKNSTAKTRDKVRRACLISQL